MDPLTKEILKRWDPDSRFTLEEIKIRLEVQRQKVKLMDLRLLQSIFERRITKDMEVEVDVDREECGDGSNGVAIVSASVGEQVTGVVAPTLFSLEDCQLPSSMMRKGVSAANIKEEEKAEEVNEEVTTSLNDFLSVSPSFWALDKMAFDEPFVSELPLLPLSQEIGNFCL